MASLRLPFDEEPESRESRIDARDRAGRARAVDPRFNVALEASAGTGKTRVLVDRYVNLLRAGVDPSNILAITFTRKAAAEMRERILVTLSAAAARGEITPVRWRELRDRTADIGISTIDAFCLSLLREFPLEADLDPGFSLADETETPRLVDESLDRALRICRGVAREDENVALVFAQLGERRARAGLAALLNRRLVAPAVLSKYLARGPRDSSVTRAVRSGAEALLGVFTSMPAGLDGFLDCGPSRPAFSMLERSLRTLQGVLDSGAPIDPGAVQAAFTRVREHFLTQDGEPRKKVSYAKALFRSDAAWLAHRGLVIGHAAAVAGAHTGYRRDLNVLVSRGTLRMYQIAEEEYRRTLDAHAVLDFSDVLLRALQLLRQMEEFAQSRYRLESRYHHVLVDEFQDTSRPQWELVSLLIQSWGEGAGVAYSGPLPPSIFIVGDRKQSIYGFRDADVSLLQEAARHLEALRPGGDVRRSISRSFRSVPALLSFVNDVCRDIEKVPGRPDAFEYEERDLFPLDAVTGGPEGPPLRQTPEGPLLGQIAPGTSSALGLVAADSPEACAELTAAEIARLLAAGTTVRDRATGVRRAVSPGDIAILFRTRESHREFEEALERRRISAYVYKGLGFFDADEIKDALALLWYLADPLSDLRAAAFMRSRVIRLSDEGLRLLAPRLADALGARWPDAANRLDAADARALEDGREASVRWRGLVDRLPPAELLDVILAESAYTVEMRGPRFQQARENLKKLRSLVRRIQNRGYATLGRIAAHLDRLAVGDESNATVDALDAVSLMTVHASKGLEFPIVFLVNLARGTGNRRDPIRVALDRAGESASVSIGDFQSDADEDIGPREQEETKRLLYVALTRARDRLYLGSVLKDGRIQPGRGSLAEVLPSSLLERFSILTGLPDPVEWCASSGVTHRFSVCAPAADEKCLGPAPVAAPSCDFEPITALGDPRRAIASAVIGRQGVSGSGRTVDGSGSPSEDLTAASRTVVRARVDDADRLVGTLVHRLLQRLGFAGDHRTSADVRGAAVGELRAVEASDIVDLERLLDDVVDAYRSVCAHPEVHELYAAAERFHEVPFTMIEDGVILRGAIDCLVRRATDDGTARVTVLEFKTGRARPEHLLQVDLYKSAARQLFPGAAVDALLVYAGGTVVA